MVIIECVFCGGVLDCKVIRRIFSLLRFSDATCVWATISAVDGMEANQNYKKAAQLTIIQHHNKLVGLYPLNFSVSAELVFFHWIAVCWKLFPIFPPYDQNENKFSPRPPQMMGAVV